jgi:hypothetical protein
MSNNKDQIKGRLENEVIYKAIDNKKQEVKDNVKKNTLPRRSARAFALMAAAISSLTISLPASAELSPALDRFSVSAGVFRTEPKLNLSLHTQYGTLQSGDIGLGMETMPRVKADIMIFDSQGLSFDYYQYSQAYTGAIANNTNILGTELTTVGNARLDIKLDFAKLEYKWWFGSDNTVLGLGAGAGYYKVSMIANATASINSSTAEANGEYIEDAIAPLLGIGVRHAINPDLRLFADASGMRRVGGKIHGDIYNAAVGVEWFPLQNVGVVLDYSMSQIELTREDTIDTNLILKHQGPSAYVKVRF